MKTSHCGSLLSEVNYDGMWEDGSYRIRWKGFVFINGISPGGESIKIFVDQLRNSNVKKACRMLKGTFFIVIDEKSTDNSYSFVDNSGLFQSYYTDSEITTSFLELIKNIRHDENKLDLNAVIEYLHLGNMYSCRTFFKSVRKIPWNKILFYSPNSIRIREIDKDIPNIDTQVEENPKSFEEMMEGLSRSLQGCNVSVDLTGGVDSRLIAVILDYYGLNFEVAISGENNHADISISREIAKSLGHPWYCTNHKIDTLEKDLNALFMVTDGLQDILVYHRLFQHQKTRRLRGIDLMVSGVGGELFKDFWWLQDFPFYTRRIPHIGRLLDFRIMPSEPNHAILSQGLQDASMKLRSNIIQELSRYSIVGNTKTYDNIYFNYRSREIVGRFLTANNNFLRCCAPYLDTDVVRIGFNLPRRMRFFNLFHRKLLTKLNPMVALIRTTEGGITASAEMKEIISKDLFRYVINRFNRLSIKVNQRYRKNIRMASPNHPLLYQYARQMKIMNTSIQILKDIDILNPYINIDHLDNKYLGRILSVALLVNYMRGK